MTIKDIITEIKNTRKCQGTRARVSRRSQRRNEEKCGASFSCVSPACLHVCCFSGKTCARENAIRRVDICFSCVRASTITGRRGIKFEVNYG